VSHLVPCTAGAEIVIESRTHPNVCCFSTAPRTTLQPPSSFPDAVGAAVLLALPLATPTLPA